MKLLITGATGLIGSSIVKEAIKNDIEVNFLTTQKEKLNNLEVAKGFYWNPKKEEILDPRTNLIIYYSMLRV